MATKQSILDTLALLPLSKLEKLESYANLLIIPEEDMLVNVNMAQMVTKAKTLAAIHFPEWTDQSASDFGIFLVELMSLFSEKDFWYLNAFANQAILTKMSVYSLAFIRSTELGYRPVVTISSGATFTVIFDAGAAINYSTGELIIQAADGTKFTNTSAIVISTTSAYTLTTTLKQGEYISESFSFNGKQVDLRKPKIDITTVEVVVDGTTWTRVENFGESGSTSTHYMILPEEDGKCSIFFGKDDYGMEPSVGSTISVKYMACLGEDGNVSAQTATVYRSNSAREANSVTMDSASTGGSEASTLAEMKNQTLSYFNYRQALLNETAVLSWLLDQSEVSAAYVVISGSTVNYFFRNASGDAPSSSEQTVIQNRMSPLISNGYTALYNTTTTVSCSTVSLEAYYLTGYDPNEVSSQVKQIVQDYTDPLVRCDYGDDFDLTELSLILRSNVPGLQNVVFLTVAGLPAANVSVAASQLKAKLSLAQITVSAIESV